MNKQNQNLDSAGDGLSPEKITEIMANPEFTAEQLPGLWQRVEPNIQAAASADDFWARWCDGVADMYERCETYPQYVVLDATLDALPDTSLHVTLCVVGRGQDLFKQASSVQLVHALQVAQKHPGQVDLVSNHIVDWATDEQLVPAVIDLLSWDDQILVAAAAPDAATPESNFGRALARRQRRIVEYVQQRLLKGDKDAWAVFLGIVSDGTLIGDAAELANAIEQQD